MTVSPGRGQVSSADVVDLATVRLHRTWELSAYSRGATAVRVAADEQHQVPGSKCRPTTEGIGQVHGGVRIPRPDLREQVRDIGNLPRHPRLTRPEPRDPAGVQVRRIGDQLRGRRDDGLARGGAQPHGRSRVRGCCRDEPVGTRRRCGGRGRSWARS